MSRSHHSPKQRLCRLPCSWCWPRRTRQQLAREPDLEEQLAECGVLLCSQCLDEMRAERCDCGDTWPEYDDSDDL